jgi:hypothetical protein
VLSDEQLFSQYSSDCRELQDRPVILQIDFLTALCVISALQLACRHPRFIGPTRQIVEQATREWAANMSVTPAIKAVLEAGFDPEHDAPIET